MLFCLFAVVGAWFWLSRPVIFTALRQVGINVPDLIAEKYHTTEVTTNVPIAVGPVSVLADRTMVLPTPRQSDQYNGIGSLPPTGTPVVNDVLLPDRTSTPTAISTVPWPAPTVVNPWVWTDWGFGQYLGTAYGEQKEIQLRISYYWPPLGGINCSRYENQTDCSTLASGRRFADVVGIAVACPAEFPFGSVFIIDHYRFVCLDRGGAIVTQDGYSWIDILYPNLNKEYSWGQLVTGTVILP